MKSILAILFGTVLTIGLIVWGCARLLIPALHDHNGYSIECAGGYLGHGHDFMQNTGSMEFVNDDGHAVVIFGGPCVYTKDTPAGVGR